MQCSTKQCSAVQYVVGIQPKTQSRSLLFTHDRAVWPPQVSRKSAFRRHKLRDSELIRALLQSTWAAGAPTGRAPAADATLCPYTLPPQAALMFPLLAHPIHARASLAPILFCKSSQAIQSPLHCHCHHPTLSPVPSDPHRGQSHPPTPLDSQARQNLFTNAVLAQPHATDFLQTAAL